MEQMRIPSANATFESLQRSPVLIIGAGMVGLTLAQTLKKVREITGVL
jgi:cation diffusion facilitator CzcD-associated flavoprotein CzcO